MKLFLAKQLIVSATMLIAAAAGAQTTPESEVIPPVELETLKPEAVNRLSISYRMGLNITVDFKKLGGVKAISNPNLHVDPANTNTLIRSYDGGYVGTDITGNNHGPGFEGTTWYWGYSSSGSAQGGGLTLSSAESPANAVSENNSGDPQHGFEIAYDRQLGRKDKWKFGLEGAFGYERLSISDSHTLQATVRRTTDVFGVPGGVVLEPPGYQGTYEGPGTVIDADPSQHSTTVTHSSTDTIVGSREIDANIFMFRLGPYAEYPLSDKFSAQFGAGLYMVVGDTHFMFHETVTIVDPVTGVARTAHHSGDGWDMDFLVGGYVGANIAYAITDDVGVFVGAQFQGAGRSVNTQKGKESVLDLGESVVVSIGASYSF